MQYLEGLLEDIFKAYFNARKNKRNKKDQLEFEQNFESNLIEVYKQILKREFYPQCYIVFVNKKPVVREVFAPSFRDRVVHHLLYNYLSEIFETDFINDSYSCRVNKGTLYGIYRLKDMIESCSKGYTQDCYILKLDISSYFYNINKNILYNMIDKKIKLSFSKDKYELVNYLLKVILFDDVTSKAIKIGNPLDWKLLPKGKSLFSIPKEKGLPIGNLTSQLFSNIYMDSFDHFIKDDLSIKYYGRYVDDFVIVHQDKYFLKKLIQTSNNYLKHNLELNIHPKKIYLQHYRKGVLFLGAFVKPYRVYSGSRLKTNFLKSIYKINNIFKKQGSSITKEQLMEIRTILNSYLGLLSKFNTYKLRVSGLKRLNESFYEIFDVSEDCRKVIIKKR